MNSRNRGRDGREPPPAGDLRNVRVTVVRMQKRQRGFTLVEALLALMILAMLLASIAAAFQAALMGYDTNSDFASVTQTARVVLGRMTSEVRTATDINSTSTSLTISPAPNAYGTTKIVYECVEGVLYYRPTKGGVESSYVLVGSGDNATVNTFYVLREDDLEGNPLSVTIRLGLSVKNESLDMTTSACLRKRQLY